MKKQADPPSPAELLLQDPTISPVGAAILWHLKERTRRTIKDLARAYYLGNTSRSTIKRHLRELVRAGHVKQHGRGKATWYTF